ncbi:MAG: hypothetical protein NT085_02390 [candidate division SR1 bacterium]|nr:hypothetical protein [candidate division SR1 bacterium]
MKELIVMELRKANNSVEFIKALLLIGYKIETVLEITRYSNSIPPLVDRKMTEEEIINFYCSENPPEKKREYIQILGRNLKQTEEWFWVYKP